MITGFWREYYQEEVSLEESTPQENQLGMQLSDVEEPKPVYHKGTIKSFKRLLGERSER